MTHAFGIPQSQSGWVFFRVYDEMVLSVFLVVSLFLFDSLDT